MIPLRCPAECQTRNSARLSGAVTRKREIYPLGDANRAGQQTYCSKSRGEDLPSCTRETIVARLEANHPAIRRWANDGALGLRAESCRNKSCCNRRGRARGRAPWRVFVIPWIDGG